MMSAIKSGVVSHSRFAKMAERDFKVKFKSYFKSRESVILWIWMGFVFVRGQRYSQRGTLAFFPQLKQRQKEYREKVENGQSTDLMWKLKSSSNGHP